MDVWKLWSPAHVSYLRVRAAIFEVNGWFALEIKGEKLEAKC